MDKKIDVPRPSQGLEELIRKHFPPSGKADRVARGLAALHQEERIKLSREEWKWVAEDPDLEDQF